MALPTLQLVTAEAGNLSVNTIVSRDEASLAISDARRWLDWLQQAGITGSFDLRFDGDSSALYATDSTLHFSYEAFTDAGKAFFAIYPNYTSDEDYRYIFPIKDINTNIPQAIKQFTSC